MRHILENLQYVVECACYCLNFRTGFSENADATQFGEIKQEVFVRKMGGSVFLQGDIRLFVSQKIEDRTMQKVDLLGPLVQDQQILASLLEEACSLAYHESDAGLRDALMFLP